VVRRTKALIAPPQPNLHLIGDIGKRGEEEEERWKAWLKLRRWSYMWWKAFSFYKLVHKISICCYLFECMYEKNCIVNGYTLLQNTSVLMICGRASTLFKSCVNTQLIRTLSVISLITLRRFCDSNQVWVVINVTWMSLSFMH